MGAAQGVYGRCPTNANTTGEMKTTRHILSMRQQAGILAEAAPRQPATVLEHVYMFEVMIMTA